MDFRKKTLPYNFRQPESVFFFLWRKLKSSFVFWVSVIVSCAQRVSDFMRRGRGAIYSRLSREPGVLHATDSGMEQCGVMNTDQHCYSPCQCEAYTCIQSYAKVVDNWSQKFIFWVKRSNKQAKGLLSKLY